MGASSHTMAQSIQPDPTTLDRKNALYMAKLSEQAERYEDMVKYMKRIVDLETPGDQLTVEERNLISVGYKNMMSVRRTAWRTIQSFTESIDDEASLRWCTDYKQTVTEEVFELIEEVCNKVVNVYVDGAIKATDHEVRVFFKKMEGDYNRYGAEITSGDKREEFRKRATEAYSDANKEAVENLLSTNPIRLGLALNYSVFYYEICEEKKDATEHARDAFDQAIDHLDSLGDDEYKDSTLIMQLLKDNLTLWNDSGEAGDNDLEVEDVENC